MQSIVQHVIRSLKYFKMSQKTKPQKPENNQLTKILRVQFFSGFRGPVFRFMWKRLSDLITFHVQRTACTMPRIQSGTNLDQSV